MANVSQHQSLPGWCLGLSLLALLLAAVVHQTGRSAFTSGVRSAVVWTPNSPQSTQDRFMGTGAPGPPDVLSFYVWNITNLDDMRALGAKPRLEQVGPFMYQRIHVRLEAWWDQQGHVATKDYSYHIPLPVGSADHLLDAPIVTVNMPLVGVIEALHASVGPSFHTLLDLLLALLAGWKDPDVMGIFMRRTPRQLLWGYDDPLLQRLDAMLPKGMIPTTRFELVYNCSGPEEAREWKSSLYNTGVNNLKDTWQLLQSFGVQRVTAWNGSECGQEVKGTDAFQFHPHVTKNERLVVWIYELMRSGVLLFKEQVNFQGVDLLRFAPDPQQVEPDPCHFQTLRGLLNLTAVTAVGPTGNASLAHGPPVYLSTPHFCDCDASLIDALDGLACDPQLHSTWLEVEPITGITMRAHKSVQMSTELTTAAMQHLEPKLHRSVVLPMFWALEQAGIDAEQGAAFVKSVYRPKMLLRWAILGLTIISATLFISGIVMVLAVSYADRRPLPLQPHQQPLPHAPNALRQEAAGSDSDPFKEPLILPGSTDVTSPV